MAASSSTENKSILTELIKTLVSVIEEKDAMLRGHSERVSKYCVLFAKKLKLPKSEIDKIHLAGLLHDIGMVYIPNKIINKASNLNDDEMLIMKKHPEKSEKILGNLSILKGVLPIIRHHHEAYDGSGYPDGLKKEAIPLGARILAFVDCYDALISEQPHKPAIPIKDALQELKNKSGTLLDPILFKNFIELITSSAKAQKSSPQETPDISPAVETDEQLSVQDYITNTIRSFKTGQLDLPVLPRVVQDVEKVIKNPQSTSDDLAKVIEKDSVISLKLLSVANSPAYRGAGKIRSVRQGIPRLGHNETRNIVITIANKSLYKAKNKQVMQLMDDLWLHSLASAFSAREIAKKCGLGDLERYFLIALVHDLGKVMLIRSLDDIPNIKSINLTDTLNAIQEVHGDFGAAILQQWKFDQDFIEVARMHDGTKFFPSTRKPVLVVNLANNLTRKIGYSFFRDEELNLQELSSAHELKIDAETIMPIIDEVKKFMKESSKAF